MNTGYLPNFISFREAIVAEAVAGIVPTAFRKSGQNNASPFIGILFECRTVHSAKIFAVKINKNC
jgi:hypothetical protein